MSNAPAARSSELKMTRNRFLKLLPIGLVIFGFVNAGQSKPVTHPPSTPFCRASLAGDIVRQRGCQMIQALSGPDFGLLEQISDRSRNGIYSDTKEFLTKAITPIARRSDLQFEVFAANETEDIVPIIFYRTSDMALVRAENKDYLLNQYNRRFFICYFNKATGNWAQVPNICGDDGENPWYDYGDL